MCWDFKYLSKAYLCSLAYFVDTPILTSFIYTHKINTPSIKDVFMLGGQSILSILLKKSDLVILGLTVSKFDLGYYSAALSLSSLAGVGLFVINANYTSRISASLSNKTTLETQLLLQKASRSSLLFSVPFLSSLVYLAYKLPVILGLEYQKSCNIFIFLFVGQLFVALSGSSYLIANLTSHENLVSKFLFDSFALKMFIGIPCSLQFGINGFAVISSISTGLWYIRTMGLVKRSFGLDASLLNLI